MSTKYVSVAAGLAAASFAFAACITGGQRSGMAQPAPSDTPLSGDYFGVAWISKDLLILSWDAPLPFGDGLPFWVSRLVSATPQAEAHALLAVPPFDDRCRIGDDGGATRLPDGRIAFQRSCRDPLDSEIDTIDLTTGLSEVLVETGTFAVGWDRYDVSGITYRPGMQDGLVQFGDWLCGGIGEVTPNGIRPFDFSFEFQDRHVNLAESFARPCDADVSVGRATWAPDGEHLALFAATGPRGVTGLDRLYEGSALLTVRRTDAAVRVLAQHLQDPFALWSPDSKWILVIEGGLGIGEGRNAWLMDSSDTGEPLRLDLPRNLLSASWSPDGSSLVAVVGTSPLGALQPTANVVTFEMRAITELGL